MNKNVNIVAYIIIDSRFDRTIRWTCYKLYRRKFDQ